LKKNKILIAGGTGFIGYHLAKRCLKLNWKVVSISTKPPKKNRKLENVNYLILDISNQKILFEKLSSNYDYVVNLAGYVDHSHKVKTMKSHFNGCKNLSLFFLNSKIKKFIQVGSCIEYGKIKSPQIEKKNNIQKTYSVYGKAKLLSTKFLLKLSKEQNFPSVIIRLYLVYGPNQDTNRVIPSTIKNAIENKKFPCSSGKQLRDFIYVEDVIDAIIKILKNKNVKGEIINIGSGKPIAIKKVILKICKLVNSGIPQFNKIKFRKDEIPKLYPSIKKAKKLIKWSPQVDMFSGLNKCIQYHKKD
tara:strand:+ start:1400 stop:2308 length:909 start_codon:yes stop_codon:yes gene_type:complete